MQTTMIELNVGGRGVADCEWTLGGLPVGVAPPDNVLDIYLASANGAILVTPGTTSDSKQVTAIAAGTDTIRYKARFGPVGRAVAVDFAELVVTVKQPVADGGRARFTPNA